jgi:predicted amidophosphoribosyltransferase
MPYCRRCGAELPKDSRFCPACGTPVVAPEMKPMETRKTFKVAGKPELSLPTLHLDWSR